MRANSGFASNEHDDAGAIQSISSAVTLYFLTHTKLLGGKHYCDSSITFSGHEHNSSTSQIDSIMKLNLVKVKSIVHELHALAYLNFSVTSH